MVLAWDHEARSSIDAVAVAVNVDKLRSKYLYLLLYYSMYVVERMAGLYCYLLSRQSLWKAMDTTNANLTHVPNPLSNVWDLQVTSVSQLPAFLLPTIPITPSDLFASSIASKLPDSEEFANLWPGHETNVAVSKTAAANTVLERVPLFIVQLSSQAPSPTTSTIVSFLPSLPFCY